MVLAGHPTGFFLIGVFDAFVFVKFPNDVAVPIDLDKVEFVLVAIFGVAQSCAAHNKSTGQYFGWKARHALPFVNDVAVHVNEIRMARHATRENGVAIITLVGIVDGGAGGIDGWVTHETSEDERKANGKCETANGKSKAEKQTAHLGELCYLL